jgi:hypothetical protein
MKLHKSKTEMLCNKVILMSRFLEVIVRANRIKHHNSQESSFSLLVRFTLNMPRNLMTE